MHVSSPENICPACFLGPSSWPSGAALGCRMHSGKTRSVPGNLEGVDLPNTSPDCLDYLTELSTLTTASYAPRKKAMGLC